MSKLFNKSAAAVTGIIVFAVCSAGTGAVAVDKEENNEKKENAASLSAELEKADISQYGESLSLTSYEPSTPELAAVNGEVPADPLAGLSPEQIAALEAERNQKKSALRDVTPTLSKNAAKSRAKNQGPVPVELLSSGAYVGDIPAPQMTAEVNAQPGQFAFVTYGWGHGVGMSQNGANFYATYAGWNYQDILFHYYPDTYLMNTGMTEEEELTIDHEPAGTTLEVVSAIVFNEVGGCFNIEAIKAQAVAVYTYLKYNGDDSHDLRGKEDPPQIVIDACESVLGEALYYNDSYALTMFSASCGGCSANCREVFYADYPYLRSVPSEYDAAYDPHWGTVTYLDAEDVRKAIEKEYKIELSDQPDKWIQPIYSEQTGYVAEVNIDGQKTVKGYPFSVALGLKSGKFNVTYTY